MADVQLQSDVKPKHAETEFAKRNKYLAAVIPDCIENAVDALLPDTFEAKVDRRCHKVAGNVFQDLSIKHQGRTLLPTLSVTRHTALHIWLSQQPVYDLAARWCLTPHIVFDQTIQALTLPTHLFRQLQRGCFHRSVSHLICWQLNPSNKSEHMSPGSCCKQLHTRISKPTSMRALER